MYNRLLSFTLLSLSSSFSSLLLVVMTTDDWYTFSLHSLHKLMPVWKRPHNLYNPPIKGLEANPQWGLMTKLWSDPSNTKSALAKPPEPFAEFQIKIVETHLRTSHRYVAVFTLYNFVSMDYAPSQLNSRMLYTQSTQRSKKGDAKQNKKQRFLQLGTFSILEARTLLKFRRHVQMSVNSILLKYSKAPMCHSKKTAQS